LVEANPSLIPEVESLLARNKLRKMCVLNGAAGAGIEGGEVEILVPPTDVGAGLKAMTAKSLAGDRCESVRVPALRVGEAWSRNFALGERCGILKVDIEGAEGRFFDDEGDFLENVDRIVVEVHEAVVPLAVIREALTKHGFTIKKESKEDSETALVFAERE
jgi:FkbM family methyltransferase